MPGKAASSGVPGTEGQAYAACSRAPSSRACICIRRRRRCRRPRCGSCRCGCSSGPSGRVDRLKAQDTGRARSELEAAPQTGSAHPSHVPAERGEQPPGMEDPRQRCPQPSPLTGFPPRLQREAKPSQGHRCGYLTNAHSAPLRPALLGEQRIWQRKDKVQATLRKLVF